MARRLSTYADSVRLHYGLAADCPKCGRSVRLNLAKLVFAGKGDRHVHRTRPRCTSCGAVGTYRILRPDPPPVPGPTLQERQPEGRGGIWETPPNGPQKPPRSILASEA
jgi:hypothetical protein